MKITAEQGLAVSLLDFLAFVASSGQEDAGFTFTAESPCGCTATYTIKLDSFSTAACANVARDKKDLN
jgi:hypothetical protein